MDKSIEGLMALADKFCREDYPHWTEAARKEFRAYAAALLASPAPAEPLTINQDDPAAGLYLVSIEGAEPVAAEFAKGRSAIMWCNRVGAKFGIHWKHERECFPPDERDKHLRIVAPLAPLATAQAAPSVPAGEALAAAADAALSAQTAVQGEARPDFCDGHCTWLDHHPQCPRAAAQSREQPQPVHSSAAAGPELDAAPLPTDWRDGPPLTWTDGDGVKHTMGRDSVQRFVSEFYERWPGGFEEHDAALQSSAPLPVGDADRALHERAVMEATLIEIRTDGSFQQCREEDADSVALPLSWFRALRERLSQGGQQ